MQKSLLLELTKWIKYQLQVWITYPEIIKKVKKYKAHLGIALDGDADRVIMCDEKSQIIDGDQIIAMIAKDGKEKILRGGSWNIN